MDLIQRTQCFVKERCIGESSGHDWGHVKRVYDTAMEIAEGEFADRVDKETVALAALLHDIADWKFHLGDDEAGPRAAREWLSMQHAAPRIILSVCTIIRELSFKGAGVATPMTSPEGAIVQDADRLDALGAVGIARAFAYGGYKHREMHDPGILPCMHETGEQYKKQQSTTINHFFEKLFLLRGRMNTETGKHIAEERHRFMVGFLSCFLSECHETQSWHVQTLQSMIHHEGN